MDKAEVARVVRDLMVIADAPKSFAEAPRLTQLASTALPIDPADATAFMVRSGCH